MTPTHGSEGDPPRPEQQNLADLALVQAVLRGEQQALESFVERMESVPLMFDLYNSRRGSLLDHQELEDLVQETFITVWRRLDSYQGHSSLDTWSFGICLNHMRNALRRKRSRPRLAGENGDELLDRPFDEEHEFDRFEPVRDCLSMLDERTSQVIQLRFFEELSFPEIGTRLAVPENSAKTLFYRGLQRMRSLLGGTAGTALDGRD